MTERKPANPATDSPQYSLTSKPTDKKNEREVIISQGERHVRTVRLVTLSDLAFDDDSDSGMSNPLGNKEERQLLKCT